MSEVAGRLATQIGATLLQKDRGGPGILLGGVPGVRHGRVTVLGGGAVGVNAARVAVGMGAEVTLIDIDLKRLAQIDELFQGKVETLMSNRANSKRRRSPPTCWSAGCSSRARGRRCSSPRRRCGGCGRGP